MRREVGEGEGSVASHDVVLSGVAGLSWQPGQLLCWSLCVVSPSLRALSCHRMKRKGNRVCHTLLKHILFTAGITAKLSIHLSSPLLSPLLTDSPHNTANMVTQLQFLEKQLQKLKDPATADLVISDMTTVRDTLTSLANLRVVMATDVGGLSGSNPLEPWAVFVEKAGVGR